MTFSTRSLTVCVLRQLADEVAQAAPGGLQLLEVGVVEDGVDLAVEQRVDPGDVAAEQARHLGLGRGPRRPRRGPASGTGPARGTLRRGTGRAPIRSPVAGPGGAAGPRRAGRVRRLAASADEGGRPAAVVGPRWFLRLGDGSPGPSPARWGDSKAIDSRSDAARAPPGAASASVPARAARPGPGPGSAARLGDARHHPQRGGQLLELEPRPQVGDRRCRSPACRGSPGPRSWPRASGYLAFISWPALGVGVDVVVDPAVQPGLAVRRPP